MTWEQLCTLGLALPETEVGTWYGTPALKVRGKGFIRLKEDGESVVLTLESVDEQEFLVRTQPELYFITDHYNGYPLVLARLSALRPPEAKTRVTEGWTLKAPASLLKKTRAEPTTEKKPATQARKKARSSARPSRT